MVDGVSSFHVLKKKKKKIESFFQLLFDVTTGAPPFSDCDAYLL